MLNILDRIETLRLIRDEKLSVARFGDGELMLMWFSNIRYQKHDRRLKKELINILNSDEENLLTCIQSQIVRYEGKPSSIRWYKRQMLWTRPLWYHYIKNRGKVFGDTAMSRPWMSFLDEEKAQESFDIFREIISGQDIVIIEGQYSRLGAGNDLFSSAKSIKRIICPATDAYSIVDDIEKKALEMDSSALFVIALGPTATVLASRLSHSLRRALDVGHIDIEYEWFKTRSQEKRPVKGKYVNEAGGMKTLIELSDDELEQYRKEIIFSFL